MPPVVLVARDHTLESALKSESGLILIIVAVAVGLLFIVTAVVIHGTGFFQTMRRYLRLSQRVAKEPEQEVSFLPAYLYSCLPTPDLSRNSNPTARPICGLFPSLLSPSRFPLLHSLRPLGSATHIASLPISSRFVNICLRLTVPMGQTYFRSISLLKPMVPTQRRR